MEVLTTKIGELTVFELESYCIDTPCSECKQPAKVKVILCTLYNICCTGDTEMLVDIDH